MRPPLLLGFCLLLPWLACGCSQESDRRAEVRGHVFYVGKPLPGGTIVFTPDADFGGAGPLAVGEIKEDGSYTLRTGPDSGAASGRYRVSVAAAVPAVTLPRKFSDPGKSDLKREVKGGAANVIDFHLE